MMLTTEPVFTSEDANWFMYEEVKAWRGSRGPEGAREFGIQWGLGALEHEAGAKAQQTAGARSAEGKKEGASPRLGRSSEKGRKKPVVAE